MASRTRTISPESRAARAAWVDQNPIRAWRLAHTPKLTILDAADRIGVGMSMIQMYEKGVHKPGPDRNDTLVELLGKDWSKKWDKWVEAKPA